MRRLIVSLVLAIPVAADAAPFAPETFRLDILNVAFASSGSGLLAVR